MIGIGLSIAKGGIKEGSLPSELGGLFTSDFTTLANLNDYVEVGSADWDITGGYLRAAYTFTGSLNNYIKQHTYGSTVLDRWIQTVSFILPTKGVTLNLMGIGCRNTNAFSSDELFCRCDMFTGAEGGVYIYKNGVVVANSGSGFSIPDGSLLTITFIKTYLSYTVTFTNVDTSQSNTVTYNCTMSDTSNLDQTCGEFSIINMGGTYDIISNSVTSTAQKNVTYGFVGDSITKGYCGGSIANSWVVLSMATVPTKSYTNLSSQSISTAGVLLAIEEIKRIAPTKYVVMIGANDLAFGVATATWKANYSTIITALKSTGAEVIHCYPTARTTPDVTPVKTYIDATYPSDVRIDTLALSLTKPDGTHPDTADEILIANLVDNYL